MDVESRGYGGLIYNFVIGKGRRCGSVCLVISPSPWTLDSIPRESKVVGYLEQANGGQIPEPS